MKSRLVQFYAALLLLGLSACKPAKVGPEVSSVAASPSHLVPVYSVAVYSPERDPAEDLTATIGQAQTQQKRILLEVGGNWCAWCRLLDKFLQNNRKVGTTLRRSFIIMKVNYSEENPNEPFLSSYPEIPAFPHFFVLDRNGKLLHSQGTAELEEGQSYNEAAFLAFLGSWAERPE